MNASRNYRSGIFGQNGIFLAVVAGIAVIDENRKTYDRTPRFSSDEKKKLKSGDADASIMAKGAAIVDGTIKAAEMVCAMQGINPESNSLGKSQGFIMISKFAAGMKKGGEVQFHDYVHGVAAYASATRPFMVLENPGKLNDFAELPLEIQIAQIQAKNPGVRLTEEMVFNKDAGVNRQQFEAYAEGLRSNAMVLVENYKKNPSLVQFGG